jgi:hypothetical protein
LWIVVAGARIGFSYATSHSRHLQAWHFTHHITADAITDALIFMAAAEPHASHQRRNSHVRPLHHYLLRSPSFTSGAGGASGSGSSRS